MASMLAAYIVRDLLSQVLARPVASSCCMVLYLVFCGRRHYLCNCIRMETLMEGWWRRKRCAGAAIPTPWWPRASEVLRGCRDSDILGAAGVGSVARVPRFRHPGGRWCRERCAGAAIPTFLVGQMSEVRHARSTSDKLEASDVGNGACVQHSRHLAEVLRAEPPGAQKGHRRGGLLAFWWALWVSPRCLRQRSTAARLAALRPARARGHVPPSRVRDPAAWAHKKGHRRGGLLAFWWALWVSNPRPWD